MTGNGNTRFLVIFGSWLNGHDLKSGSSPAIKIITATVSVLLLGGCGEASVSALAPAGEAAAEIARVTWVMIVGTLLLMMVMSALGLHAVYRRDCADGGPSARAVILCGGVIVPSVVLLALLIYGVRSGDGMLAVDTAPLEVRVTARQWWWQFEYPDDNGQRLVTANELHLPAGQSVDIVVESRDVIHSFWVPALGGKIDAIPGRTNRVRLHPTRTGRFRGHCAEFCGAQHARMAFHVEVHPPEEFAALIDSMRGLDRIGAGPEPGRTAFEAHCAECHSRSTAQVEDLAGPNLARLPERPQLGAGTLANTPDNLRQWIARHQQLKPGNHMPDHGELDEDTVEALARYLEAQ